MNAPSPLILIAGPYRSATGDDPALMADLMHRDAVLRLPGESTGADQDVAIAREHGLPIYLRLEDVPGCAPPDAARTVARLVS